MKSWRSWWRQAGLAALVSALAGCASVPGSTALRVSVQREKPFVIHEVDGAQGWGLGTHPFLCEVSPRRLALTYWVSGDGITMGTAPLPWPAYTDDGGATWQFGNPFSWTEQPTNEVFAFQAGDKFNHFDMGLFYAWAVLPDGRRVSYSRSGYLRGGQYHFLGLWSDDGRSWSGVREAPLRFPEDFGALPEFLACDNPAVATRDGKILFAPYGRGGPENQYSTYLFESSDGGASFDYVSTIAGPRDTEGHGPAEAALLATTNGELVCVMRTGVVGYGGTGTAFSLPLLMARSSDGGKTWKRRHLSVGGVMPRLIRMSNGVLVMATGRPANRLLFSLDEGRTWGREVALTAADRKTSGYCSVQEVAPGRLLAVYDMVSTSRSGVWLWEPKEVNSLMGVHLAVSPRF